MTIKINGQDINKYQDIVVNGVDTLQFKAIAWQALALLIDLLFYAITSTPESIPAFQTIVGVAGI